MTTSTKTIAAVLAVLALAACSGSSGDDEAAEAAPEEAEPVALTVQVTAAQAGFGCTASKERAGVDVGNGSRLTVTDEDGDVIGTGTFDLSPGLERGVDTCDWTATAEVPEDAGFYQLDAGGDLGTFSAAELAPSWDVALHITTSGDVQVER